MRTCARLGNLYRTRDLSGLRPVRDAGCPGRGDAVRCDSGEVGPLCPDRYGVVVSGDGLPSGTVTFLFTDIEGSTPLWDSFPGAMGAALARHDEIVRSAIDARQGRVFSTGGDGFGVVFGSASDAVAAALAAQKALAIEEWSGGPVLRVRMGLHTGEAEERDGDLFGPPVNRAARIMGVANGGQVLLSDLTAALVAQLSEVKLVDLGAVELKGVAEPVHVFGASGSGHEWLDAPLLVGQISRGNLPRLNTESVGDLVDLHRRVANLAEASVVTLTGSGGVGKTRASIEIGWLVTDEFIDGAWFVELAPVTAPDLAASAVASALGVQPQPGTTVVEAIVEWCIGRRMLLILDNCEHVIAPVAALVEAIVSACAGVTTIATSREPLGVPGETVVRVPSLAERDAIELFVLRAKSADASFDPTPVEVEAIAAICARLDGIPLAIELAAARTRSLSPAEILSRLGDRFQLVRGGNRGVLERHQTLRATVGWSYRLLSAEAQLLFDRLSAFSGTFDLAAAEGVCAADPLDELDVVDLLSELVDKSMLVAERARHGTRYRLLETLRQYGEERLGDRDESAEIRDAHLRHYATVSDLLDAHWHSPDVTALRELFDADWDNLNAAHAWAISTGDIDHAHELVATAATFAMDQLRRDHQQWCTDTLELAAETGRHDVTTICNQAVWELWDNNPDNAVVLGERALAIDHSDTYGRIVTLLGSLAQGHDDKAMAVAAELRAALPNLSDTGVPGRRSDQLSAAIAVLNVSDPASISADAETALAIAHSFGAPHHIAMALSSGAKRWLVVDPPNFDRALADLTEAVCLRDSVGASSTGDRVAIARILTRAGDPRASEVLHEALQRAYDERLWAAVDEALRAAVKLLADDGPTVAAQVSDYIAGSSRRGNGRRDLDAKAIQRLQSTDGTNLHRTDDNGMDRHQIVAIVLDALGTDPD